MRHPVLRPLCSTTCLPLVLLAFLVGGPRADGETPKAPVVPPRPGAEDVKVLREARVGQEGTALLDYFRTRTLSAAQRKRIAVLVPQLGDDEFKVRQQASAALLALGPPALPHLRLALDSPDEEIKDRLRTCIAALEEKAKPEVSAAAVRLLRLKAPADALPVLLAYLPDAENRAIENEVVCALAVLGVRDGKVSSEVAAALTDREPVCRGAAAAILGRSGSAAQRAAVTALLKDADPRARFRAAQGLLASHDYAGVPTLIALLTEAPAPLALEADDLLFCLAGPRAPRVALGQTPATRRLCRQAWANWWRSASKLAEHRDAALARADTDLPGFNRILAGIAAARQFVSVFIRGDGDAITKLAEFPFLFGGEQAFANAADLTRVVAAGNGGVFAPGAFIAGAGLRGPGEPRSPTTAWSVRSLQSTPRTVSPMERGFLNRYRHGEVSGYELLAPFGAGGSDHCFVLVRQSLTRPRIVGYDPQQQMMLFSR
jgi:hypothetical protein